MLTIYGSSDDLVEIEGHVSDEVNVYDPVDIIVGWPEAAQAREAAGVAVRFEYGPSWHSGLGVWAATVVQLAEDVLVPWPVRIEQVTRHNDAGRGYSVRVVIECPDDVPVCVRSDGRDDRVWTPDMPHRHLAALAG